ncbi:MAG: hypothetical protein L0H96_21665, partial [Humibacillus sp.]|nr:hypothetical protein [Humibacillus sp.]
ESARPQSAPAPAPAPTSAALSVPPPVPAAPIGLEAGPVDAAPPAPSTAPAPARRFSPVLKRLGVVLIGVVVVVVGRSAFDRSSADLLEVGQCVSRDGNEIAQVDCADATAKYKVLLIQKDTQRSSIESVCSGAPTTTTSYFESKEGETQGNVICLSGLS